MGKIDRFAGPYGFLSNFYPCLVRLDGKGFPTVEHAFQAAKTLSPIDRCLIAGAVSPTEAKQRGRKVVLREDWEAVKEAVMLDLLRQKFRDPDLRLWLLRTNGEELIEGNHWNDTYWGVCEGQGKNRLGHLLMQVRTEIRNELK